MSKNYLESLKLIDKNNFYNPREAFEIISKVAKAKFDETIELHVKLGVDPRHADQQVRGTVLLPNGTGKNVKILVFAKGDKAKEAIDSGADYVGDQELINKIQNENWFDFDIVVATPDMMGIVGRIGKLLGPKGLMPNPKSGTVTLDISKTVSEIKYGKVEYRVDKTAIVHVGIGKKTFSIESLLENFNTIMSAIIKSKPASSKGQYIKSVSLCSTMSPAVKINTSKII